jgi:hypothetical protein
MTDVTAQNILDLYTAPGLNPVLADDLDGNLSIVERVAARQAHWAILAYRIDLQERFPEFGLTAQAAQAVADEINAGMAAKLSAAILASESARTALIHERTRAYSAQIIIQRDRSIADGAVIVVEAPERSTATVEMFDEMRRTGLVRVDAASSGAARVRFGTEGYGAGVVEYRVTPMEGARVMLLDRLVPPPSGAIVDHPV